MFFARQDMDKDTVLLELRDAKSALIRWRQYAQGLITGMSVGSRATPVEPHECVFGKWFHSTGKEQLSHIPHYHAANESHAVMHRIHDHIHQLMQSDQIEHAQQQWKHLIEVYHKLLDDLAAVEHHLSAEFQPA